MRLQREDENRLLYLLEVLKTFMDGTIAGEEVLHYDGADCDGTCLANDFEIAIETQLHVSKADD